LDDAKKDVARFDVPVLRDGEETEALGIFFEKAKTVVNMVVGWDDELVKIPISFF
jgi:hypothetical protein